MKEIRTTAGVGHPFYRQDIAHLNNAIQDVATALGKLLGTNAFLQETIIAVAGNVHTTSAGWMILNGELLYFDAQNVDTTGAPANTKLYWEAFETVGTNDPRTNANATVSNCEIYRNARLAKYVSGSNPAGTVLYSGIAQPYGALANIEYKEFWRTVALTTVTLNAGWSQSASGCGFGYRLKRFNQTWKSDEAPTFQGDLLEFKGQLTSGVGNTNGIICTLPVGYRPANTLYSLIPVIGGGVGIDILTIHTNGDVEVSLSTGQSEFSFEGLRFYLR